MSTVEVPVCSNGSWEGEKGGRTKGGEKERKGEGGRREILLLNVGRAYRSRKVPKSLYPFYVTSTGRVHTSL